ncbi:hypothetical protein GCM10010052_04120 [Paenarthrobacter histidinolovorans]|nr:hypothetical protein GCM10010052_04120 [Paenarthrobacter histidinolovorans]
MLKARVVRAADSGKHRQFFPAKPWHAADAVVEKADIFRLQGSAPDTKELPKFALTSHEPILPVRPDAVLSLPGVGKRGCG